MVTVEICKVDFTGYCLICLLSIALAGCGGGSSSEDETVSAEIVEQGGSQEGYNLTYVTDGYYFDISPQGDAARIYNYVRLVRDM